MKKVLLMGVLAVISVGVINVNASAATTKKSVKVASSESEKKAAVAQAEKFINEYLRLSDNDVFDKWAEKIGTTSKFREEYKKYEQYIELTYKILESKDDKELAKLKQAQKYLEKYHADYDPIFDASITDTRNDKPFKMSSYDEKTGIVILENNKELTGYPKVVENGKERSINVEVPVKVVKQNGKWLVDRAGNVNLKQNK